MAPAPDPEFERRHPDVRVVVGDFRHEATLRAAGVADAAAIVLTSGDDLANLHAALAAGAINERARIVIRLFDDELGQHIGVLLPRAIALSSRLSIAPGSRAEGVLASVMTAAGRRRLLAIEDPDAPSAGSPRPMRSSTPASPCWSWPRAPG